MARPSMARPWFIACAGLLACGATAEDTTTTDRLPLTDEAYTLTISAGAAAFVDAPFIRREVEAAIALYRREIAAPAAPVTLLVDAPDCLRTGYDMASRTVQFCNNADTPRLGTASADVIHHEVFHALLCGTKPAWCDDGTSTNTDRVAMHEGLADYFAYTLAPDDAFGEGFYRDKPFVRRYRVPTCYSLVGGGHEKGNTIASALIAGGRGLADVARLAAGSELTLAALFGATPSDACFGLDPPRVERTVTGYPASTLERYRIRPGAPLVLAFAGDPAFQRRYPDLAIRWEPAPALFAIRGGPTTFQLAATGSDGFDKVTALYLVGDEVVGAKNFYFQIAAP